MCPDSVSVDAPLLYLMSPGAERSYFLSPGAMTLHGGQRPRSCNNASDTEDDILFLSSSQDMMIN